MAPDDGVSAVRKRTIRSLRKLEYRMRGLAGDGRGGETLVWDEFFSFRPGAHVRYPFSIFTILDRPSRKRAINDFLEAVVGRMLAQGGRASYKAAPEELLGFLGLPGDATPDTVKKRFRQMAHELHPDHGGDSHLMTQLLQLYREMK